VIVLGDASDPAGGAATTAIEPGAGHPLLHLGSTSACPGRGRTTAAVAVACRLSTRTVTPDDRLGLEGSLSVSAAYNRVWAGLLNGVTLYCYDTYATACAVSRVGEHEWRHDHLHSVSLPSARTATPDAADSVRLVTFGGEAFFGSTSTAPDVPPDAELRNRLGAAKLAWCANG
jgi:hypothetical protein